MYVDSVKLVTVNINGLHNPVKRWKTLSKLKRDKVQIAMIQETHLSDEEHSKLNKLGFKHVFYSSHSSGRRRGVAILIAGSLNYEHLSKYVDKEGRFIMITGNIEGSLTTILNVYVPPGSNWSTYKQILEMMTTKSQGTLICGGDFNVTLNAKVDSSNGKGDLRNIGKKMTHFMEDTGLFDVWRDSNATKREYTHYSHAHNVYSRLDYFFMFKNDLFKIQNCEIGPCTISDHNPVYVQVSLMKNKRSTLWRLNTNILNYSPVKENLAVAIREYFEHNDNDEVNPGILWDAFKAVIRGKIISISSHQKKAAARKIVNLEEKLLKLEREHSKHMKEETKSEIKQLKREIDDINTLDVQKKLIFTKQLHYDSGGKSLKLLSYKLRKQQAERTIHKIKNPLNNNVENEHDKIKQCFQNYYRNLYSQTYIDNDRDIDAFLLQLNLPTLTDEQNDKLTSPITKEEIHVAIKRLKKGKMAGTDGFGPEWYKTMENYLTPSLLKTFNWVMEKKSGPCLVE